ncbi:MAG: hypothetical protein HY999_02020 [Nitrospinae bacterium]|nr:hypothetical protein [Nitrospinota bacterium]
MVEEDMLKAFFSRYKKEILLIILTVYVIILGLGTIGELFEIEWILNLPIFRPVGK